MGRSRIDWSGRVGLGGLFLCLAASPSIAAQNPPTEEPPRPAQAPAARAVPGPAESFSPRLGMAYRLVPYGQGLGAMITEPPAPGSPASQLWLEPGDTIINLDGLPIQGPADLENHYGRTSVVFVNIRTGQPQAGTIFLSGNPTPGPPVPVPTPYILGVVVAPVAVSSGNPSPFVAPGTALRPTYGLRVNSLTPGGAAQRAGLEVGDIILSANRIATSDLASLRRAIAGSGGQMRLTVRNVRPPHDIGTVDVRLDRPDGAAFVGPLR